ncbi:hypothetical protein B0H10DRAFT_2224807 [Mycena sp. CBHHK59/15]|nr:hypothetical protein B0H10DRAFT_2224807 [Mycena sp. CBHHK59/15]
MTMFVMYDLGANKLRNSSSKSSLVLRLLAALLLQRLSVNLDDLFPGSVWTDFAYPLFAQITHLHLFDWRSREWDGWSGLARIPRLTHLSFSKIGIADCVCRGALLHCKALEVFAILYSSRFDLDDRGPDHAALATDPRLVLLVVRNYWIEWGTGARGGEDYWVRADALVKQRRSGETKSYFTTPDDDQDQE